ncbi:hypothetical protein Tco_1414434, partial [Tanacetum coccineum]
MATLNESFPQGTDSGSGPRCQDTILGGAEAQIRFEAASKQANDPPLSRVNTLGSGEDIMKLMELIEHCIKLSELAYLTTAGLVNTVRLNLMPPVQVNDVEVNAERQIQALVDKKKVIISETSIRCDLKLDDAEGSDCLPTATIFAELEKMGLPEQTSWGMTRHKEVYVTPSHTKKVFANMKIPCKGFSGRVTPLFSTMMVQATDDMGADSATPTDSYSTPIISQPSSSKPQKKKSRRKQRKENGAIEPITDEAHVSTPSYDLPQSGEDKESQAVGKEKEVKTFRAKKVKKEDASKQGRKIEDLDADAEVTLVNETQEMNDDNMMFDTDVLEEPKIKFEKVVEKLVVSVATTTMSIPVSPAKIVTTASANVEIPDELTLAQTLIEIKTVKPKPITTAATTVTSVRPRVKGIIFHDQEEQVSASTKAFSSSQSQLLQVKDKGKGNMVEPKVPLKKKDQVALDEVMARNLEAQLQAELIEEERLTRQKEEEANIDLIELWDNTQAMMEADFELVQRLQAEEQGEITIEERSRLFVELMNRRKKHFA